MGPRHLAEGTLDHLNGTEPRIAAMLDLRIALLLQQMVWHRFDLFEDLTQLLSRYWLHHRFAAVPRHERHILWPGNGKRTCSHRRGRDPSRVRMVGYSAVTFLSTISPSTRSQDLGSQLSHRLGAQNWRPIHLSHAPTSRSAPYAESRLSFTIVNCQLACHRDDRAFLRVFTSAIRQLQAQQPKVVVRSLQ